MPEFNSLEAAIGFITCLFTVGPIAWGMWIVPANKRADKLVEAANLRATTAEKALVDRMADDVKWWQAQAQANRGGS